MTKVLNGKHTATMEDDAIEFIKRNGLEEALAWMETEIPKFFGDEGCEIYLQPEIPEECEEVLIVSLTCSSLGSREFLEQTDEFTDCLEDLFPSSLGLLVVTRN
ncbi:MAG: hypothetical protein NUW37_05270 [Planctomycetes bacterium]|nr:hypothetical protein [Planctomycetota bacterium]